METLVRRFIADHASDRPPAESEGFCLIRSGRGHHRERSLRWSALCPATRSITSQPETLQLPGRTLHARLPRRNRRWTFRCGR